MKILHTADWHLGKKLDSYSRLAEQQAVLNEICEIAETQAVDAIIIAGDVFDNFNPSAEATELLYNTLYRLSAHGSRLVVAIAGNHDSPERIEVPDALARACGIVFIGYPAQIIKPFVTEGGIKITHSDCGYFEAKLPQCDFPLRIIHTPYANELRLKRELNHEDSDASLREHLKEHWQEIASKYLDDNGFNLLVTHLFVMKAGGEMPEEPEEEKPILHIGGASAIFSENFPNSLHYVALGHLHRYQQIDTHPCPIVYSSSPLAYSFAEANQAKYVVLLQAQKGKLLSFEPITLQKGKRLLSKKFDTIDAAVLWLHDNQEALVQLTIASDFYLEAADKKRLTDAHANLIQLIPEIRSDFLMTASKQIDLTMRMEDIFSEYFLTKKGQKPNDEIIGLFKEVLSVED